MKTVLIFTVTTMLCYLSKAALVPPSDSLLSKKPASLSFNDFMSYYAVDDSSTALINYYFFRREKMKKSMIVSAGGYGVTGAAAAVVASATAGALTGMILVFVGVLALFFTFNFATSFLPRTIQYSKKKLRKQLEDYEAGKSIPKKVAANNFYQRFVVA